MPSQDMYKTVVLLKIIDTGVVLAELNSYHISAHFIVLDIKFKVLLSAGFLVMPVALPL